MEAYSTITLKPDRDQALRNRHPWIFSGALQKVSDGINTGDIVAVCGHDGRLLGYCHYHAQSTIAGRVFHFSNEPILIDEQFWWKKFQKARAYRELIGFGHQPHLTGYRLIYAEGDELPGVIVDIFDNVAVMQLLTVGARKLQGLLVDFLHKELRVEHVLSKSVQANTENQWLQGEAKEVIFSEYGLQFSSDVAGGQKTGFFLDQRDNRQLVARYAKDRRVLDAFCYSGGFSTMALMAGAKKVDSLDVSSAALELCRQNVERNVPHPHHQLIEKDCFEFLREMPKDAYDLIILDPPAFAKSAKAVSQGARGYKDINLQALKRIQSGGLLFTFSCSQQINRDFFRKIVFSAAADAGRSVKIVHQLSQAPDHPIDIFHPEGEYLKGLMLYVED